MGLPWLPLLDPLLALTLAGALALAWGADARWGEPASRWHPVAWLGTLLGVVGRRIQPLAPAPAFVLGALAWVLLAAGVAVLAWGWQAAALALPWWAGVALLALALKPLFAARMLLDEVAAVEAALAQGLEAGRARLAWLVSRDVTRLSAEEVRQSALETLAENLNDSVISPLLWTLLLGLPGAAVYRLANTADAMWGYRGTWEWAGKWAARADDLLSWPGARLTAALLLPVVASWRAWAALRAQAARTPSPNGGWPMGALALRLGVRLTKPGVYVLHAAGREPAAPDVASALHLAAGAARRWALAVGLALAAAAHPLWMTIAGT